MSNAYKGRTMLARAAFYPSLMWNIALEKITSRNWYDRVDDTVILGALPFRGMTQQLIHENVKAVVTMNEEYETKYFVNTKEEWEAAGIEQLRLDTVDLGVAPSLDKLSTGVDFILRQQQLEHSVYVHCKAGRARSTTLVVCYLMKRCGYSPEDAISFVRSKRPHVWIAPRQLEAIQSFYKTVIHENTT